MKAIARLIALYFTATSLARWLTCISGSIVVFALGALAWMFGAERSSDPSRAINVLASYAAFAIAAIAVALCGLFLASTLMPAMIANQASGRQASVLPYGKPKLLASALATVLLLSLPIALALPLLLGIVLPQIDFVQLFLRAYVLTCLNLTFLYFAYWIASTRRTAVGRLAGAMIVLAIILGPSGGKYLNDSAASLIPPAMALLIVWLAFAALYLRSGDVHVFIARYVPSFKRSAALRRGDTVKQPARIDLLLGTARPWQLALIQIVPVLVATRFVRSPHAWLFYLTLFSAVSGAFASTAASRARALWLRTEWTRHGLFKCVERSFLRHNCYALGLLVVGFVAMGSHLDFSTRLLAYGLPLLILGSTVSTYLGLMMTRQLGWLEIVLAVVTMGLLMLAALLAARQQASTLWLIVIECALAALVVAFRYGAAMRWQNLDWMECRRDFRTKASS